MVTVKSTGRSHFLHTREKEERKEIKESTTDPDK